MRAWPERDKMGLKTQTAVALVDTAVCEKEFLR